MLGKLIITGEIKVKAGLHIGGGEGFSAIGAVDKVVIKDAVTNLPIIPGSSLKGKIRSLLASQNGSKKHSDDGEEILRLFGCAAEKAATGKPARLQFFDCFLTNKDELKGEVTEIKFENTIEREKCKAKPRQNERVVCGAVFKLNLVYNAEDANEIKEDFKIITKGMQLLQLDYLGGNGTRGYGRVALKNLKVQALDETFDEKQVHELNTILSEANEYATNIFN